MKTNQEGAGECHFGMESGDLGKSDISFVSVMIPLRKVLDTNNLNLQWHF